MTPEKDVMAGYGGEGRPVRRTTVAGVGKRGNDALLDVQLYDLCSEHHEAVAVECASRPRMANQCALTFLDVVRARRLSEGCRVA